MFNANEYYEFIRAIFQQHENLDVAEKQTSYMKDRFAFFGMKAPIWQPILKENFANQGILMNGELKEFIETCFDDDCREMQYTAIEMVQKGLKKQPESFVETLEYLIITKSWWDSVDWIATLVGVHFQRFPHLILPTTERWMASGNMWLQRVSIIFQLKYKEKTDLDLLFKYILQMSHSKEFFIQKASGWALRDLTRWFPEEIKKFVSQHPELAPLTKREALRLLK